MFKLSALLHYSAVLITTLVPGLFCALAQGRTSFAAFQAIRIQPMAEKDISGTLFIGNALIETGAIIGLLFGVLLLSGPIVTTEFALWHYFGKMGIACALGFSGAVVAYMSAYPVEAACYAIARQPFFSKKIQIFTIVMESIMQSAIILAFVIAIWIKGKADGATSLDHALQLVGAGLAIGIGSVGPTIGLGLFLQKACTSLGFNRFSYTKIFTFSFLSEAIIEASVVFSALIALLILKSPVPTDGSWFGLKCLSAAICIGLATLGVGIALGKTAARASHHIGVEPELYAKLSSTSLLAQALIEAQMIYAFIIALRIVNS